ncbi:MAG TPA: tetratricopeptide repeat protein [Vicinamibacterales bacterium]|jgi:superkiller protein 3
MRPVLTSAAVALLSSALASAPPQENAGRAKAAYARAVELESQGNYPAALSLLWEAAGLTPKDADVQQRLGEALERIGALEAAADAYKAALAARPASRKSSTSLIVALAKAGRGAEAVARARALADASPSDPDAYFVLGLAQSEHDVTDALANFQKALSLAPRHTLARYNLALVLRRLDRLPDAMRELERTIATEPRPQAHYTLGVIYWHEGDAARAAQSLRAAVAQEPGYADAHYTLGAVLKSQRDWAGAAASLRRAIALRPDAASHYTLAQVLAASGDDAGSRAHLDEAERLRRQTELEREALTWTSVGIQKLHAGDAAGALEEFRRATRVFEPYAPAHYQMGLALDRLGRGDEAQAAFARARALNPSLVSPRDTPRSPK